MRQAAPRDGAVLDRSFSLYLDLVRACAALMVVVAHFRFFAIFDARQVALIPDYGRMAVIAFFVLSGFVIAYSVEHKNPTLADYAVARCTRLYSVALPVLLLAFGLAGSVLALTDASIDSAYQLAKPWLYLPLHLLFLGDAWSLVEHPPWLVPYWSLDYEAWYYVLFGVAWYLRGRRRAIVLALMLALVGPRLWLLLPVWLSGAWLYRWQKHARLARGPARALWAASLALLLWWGWLDLEPGLRAAARQAWPFAMRMGSADRVLADYPVTLLVLANFIGARHAGFDRILQRAAAPIRFLSARTFTLYLSHGLVIGFWQTLVPIRRGAPADLAAIAVAIAAATLALYPLTEALRLALTRTLDAARKQKSRAVPGSSPP